MLAAVEVKDLKYKCVIIDIFWYFGTPYIISNTYNLQRVDKKPHEIGCNARMQ